MAQAGQPQQQSIPGKPDQEKSDQEKPRQVSERVTEGMRVYYMAPVYPRRARMQGLQGEVLIDATIDTKGNLTHIQVVQGDKILAESAVDAVKKWKYRPSMVDDRPVPVETRITVRFYKH
ncbi:MAG TPA: energy transducer TonB [Candidatus Angelobacter sp.]|nr:energy transducer TonB [Candidatus Angelobacter sp.]